MKLLPQENNITLYIIVQLEMNVHFACKNRSKPMLVQLWHKTGKPAFYRYQKIIYDKIT